MIYHEVEQGTEAWLALRRGKFSASTFKNLFMGKTTQGYNDEIMRVVYEKLTGESPESFVNDYMRRGTELEPFAREKYMMETFNDVKLSGFYELNEWVGCSLDGEIGSDKTIEIKCPKHTTMINYLLKPESLYNDYKYQVQGQLWITGRTACDMIAYHPKLKLLIHPVKRDDKLIGEIERKVNIAILKATDTLISIVKLRRSE